MDTNPPKISLIETVVSEHKINKKIWLNILVLNPVVRVIRVLFQGPYEV